MVLQTVFAVAPGPQFILEQRVSLVLLRDSLASYLLW